MTGKKQAHKPAQERRIIRHPATPEPEGLRIGEAIEALCRSVASNDRSDATIKHYRQTLGIFLAAVGDLHVEQLNIDLLRSYINGQRARRDAGEITQETVRTYARALRLLLRWLYREGHIQDDLAALIEIPSKKRARLKVARREDIERMLAHVNDPEGSEADARTYALLVLLVSTGIRVGEAANLQLDDVDLARGTALVDGKSGQRVVFLMPQAVAALERWLERRPAHRSKALFVDIQNTPGAPMTANGLAQILKRLAKAAGATGPTSPHAYRHYYARFYLQSGGDLSTLSQLLGHSSIAVTASNYSIFATGHLRQFAEKHNPMRDM